MININTVEFMKEYIMLQIKSKFSENCMLYEDELHLDPLHSDSEEFKFIGYNGGDSLIRSFNYEGVRFLNMIDRKIVEYNIYGVVSLYGNGRITITSYEQVKEK